jgi:hypothetical protein
MIKYFQDKIEAIVLDLFKTDEERYATLAEQIKDQNSILKKSVELHKEGSKMSRQYYLMNMLYQMFLYEKKLLKEFMKFAKYYGFDYNLPEKKSRRKK